MGGNLAFAAECARALETAVLFMTAEARLGPHDVARVKRASRRYGRRRQRGDLNGRWKPSRYHAIALSLQCRFAANLPI